MTTDQRSVTIGRTGDRYTTRFVGLGLAVVMIVLGCTLNIAGVSHEGQLSVFILLAGVCLWLTEALPIAVTSLLLLVLCVLTGSVSQTEAISGFANSTVLFLIFAFQFGTVLNKTKYAKLMAGAILKWSKGRVKRVCFGIMFFAWFLSWWMSALTAVIIALPLGISVLEGLGHEKLKSRLGKVLLIGIPMAVTSGSMASPLGAAANVMAIGLLETALGIAVSFTDWLIIGIPAAILGFLGVYFGLIWVFKPEEVDKEKLQVVVDDLNKPVPTTRYDKVGIVTLAVLVILLVSGSWIKVLSSFNVGLLGLAWFTIPKVDLLTWDDIIKTTHWHIVLMTGAVNALVNVMVITGGAEWLATFMVGLVGNMPPILILLCFALICQALHSICPFGPGLITLVFMPFLGVATATGAFPVTCVVMLCGWTLTNAYVVPITVLHLVTLGTGWWQMKDAPLPMLVPFACLLFSCSVWLYFITKLLGVA